MTKIKVAHQGIKGAYSYEAAVTYFANEKDIEIVPKKEFADVFLAVKNGECDYGVVPVENSIKGGIIKNLDLLGEYDLYITGEQHIAVNHTLMGIKGATLDDIKCVYSHEQGLAQCEEFISTHKGWSRIPYFNTAISAKFVADEGKKENAAIASKAAAELYGLEILAENIAASDNNVTCFCIISAKKPHIKNADKATLYFSLKHEKGSLAKALGCLTQLNLTKIESRPSHKRNWEYRFYIDVLGNEELFKKSFDELKKQCTEFCLLGIYKSDNSL